MLRISKSEHIHLMHAGVEPVAHVESGTRMVLETWDALEGKTLKNNGPTDYPPLTARNTNPATGPVFVNNACPGDVLEVEIHDIVPDKTGYMYLHEEMLTRDNSRGYEYVQFEIKDGLIMFNGKMLPADPMIGVIGTAPLESAWCQENGNHGGNMDTRIIKKGVKVLLPVFVEGGLLALGDLHAVQGDWEVFGQGIEIGAEVELSVRLRKDIKIQWPVVIGEDRISCIVSGSDIKKASYQAVREMGQFLVNALGLDYRDASALVAFYGNLILCQIVNPQMTVRMEIKKEHIELCLKERKV